jgi:uncharacterized protein YfaT (DUF1175 family)
MVAEAALAQAESPAADWHPDQRDCAGLVRYAYRAAWLKLQPSRLEGGLWTDSAGRRAAFADAETLISRSFATLGRGAEARQALRSGDLVAFRQIGDAEAPVYHLMIVVLPREAARGQARVVYHPGSRGAQVRVGRLDSLEREAPAEWRPVPENPHFLGFFRFKEWR